MHTTQDYWNHRVSFRTNVNPITVITSRKKKPSWIDTMRGKRRKLQKKTPRPNTQSENNWKTSIIHFKHILFYFILFYVELTECVCMSIYTRICLRSIFYIFARERDKGREIESGKKGPAVKTSTKAVKVVTARRAKKEEKKIHEIIEVKQMMA